MMTIAKNLRKYLCEGWDKNFKKQNLRRIKSRDNYFIFISLNP